MRMLSCTPYQSQYEHSRDHRPPAKIDNITRRPEFPHVCRNGKVYERVSPESEPGLLGTLAARRSIIENQAFTVPILLGPLAKT